MNKENKTEEVFQCICGKQFDNKKSLACHKTNCKIYQEKSKEQKLKELKARRLPNGMFKCENLKCNKEHDGSYGSGRFCSDHCRRSFSAQHVDFVELGKKQRGKKQDHSKQTAPYGTWICSYCKEIFRTKNILQKHIHDNHLKIDSNGNIIPWNKNLTKETDVRVAKNAKHVSESFKKSIENGYVNPTWTDEYWTEEKRKERSEMKKKLYADHPEKHPNRKLADNRKKMTYPEQIAYDWLTRNDIQFEHQKEFILNGVKRFVDFYIPSKLLFIEIDGEYWHPVGNESDKLKDEIATKNGFLTLRIRPKNNVEKQLEDYFCGLQ